MWKTLKCIVKGDAQHVKQEIKFSNLLVAGEKEINEVFNRFFMDSIVDIKNEKNES